MRSDGTSNSRGRPPNSELGSGGLLSLPGRGSAHNGPSGQRYAMLSALTCRSWPGPTMTVQFREDLDAASEMHWSMGKLARDGRGLRRKSLAVAHFIVNFGVLRAGASRGSYRQVARGHTGRHTGWVGVIHGQVDLSFLDGSTMRRVTPRSDGAQHNSRCHHRLGRTSPASGSPEMWELSAHLHPLGSSGVDGSVSENCRVGIHDQSWWGTGVWCGGEFTHSGRMAEYVAWSSSCACYEYAGLGDRCVVGWGLASCAMR